ncbi:hypothetical protein VTP01DRAFT_891 [Rhizomucor pusillus]|uniref:uncharacterized protein n=1 Tax=Rhizomucor pusillus TaxID=4840 RepID=UPI003742D70A
MSTNEQSRKLAAEANQKAKEYHQARTTEMARCFDDLEMDQPLPRDHTDPGNSSWIDVPEGQCQCWPKPKIYPFWILSWKDQRMANISESDHFLFIALRITFVSVFLLLIC